MAASLWGKVAEADELERTVLKCMADRADHIGAGDMMRSNVATWLICFIMCKPGL